MSGDRAASHAWRCLSARTSCPGGRRRGGVDHVEGRFDRRHVQAAELRYPARRSAAEPTTLFSTEVPSFWDSASLTNLLRTKGVEVNADSPSRRVAARRASCSGSGRPCCSSACSSLLARRARAGGLGSPRHVRPLARRGASIPQTITVTFEDVAGIDEAKAELEGDRRLPAHARPVRQARRPHPARCAAVRAARDRQDVARPRRRRGGTRGVLLDRRVGVHRGDRRRRRVTGP